MLSVVRCRESARKGVWVGVERREERRREEERRR